jgi:hypothetical protein
MNAGILRAKDTLYTENIIHNREIIAYIRWLEKIREKV